MERTSSRMGSRAKKILLLLEAGIALSLTHRPDVYFSIIKKAAKEWKKIDERSLRDAIRRLYESKLISCRENKDKTVTLVLSEEGRKRILNYNLGNIQIKKPSRWDNLWRLVAFDIPEGKKSGRMALAAKLKELGFYPMQKSVYIHPYECKDEIDFITEIFKLTPHVRFLRIKDVDIELDLKNRFRIL